MTFTEKNAETESLQAHLEGIAAAFETHVRPLVDAAIAEATAEGRSYAYAQVASDLERAVNGVVVRWDMKLTPLYRHLQQLNGEAEAPPSE